MANPIDHLQKSSLTYIVSFKKSTTAGKRHGGAEVLRTTTTQKVVKSLPSHICYCDIPHLISPL